MKLAMKCSQEQWDSIKDKLTNYHLITNFDKSNYLINCYKDSTITNLDFGYASAWVDEIQDEWNEQLFLKACGIETEKIFKGIELQFRRIGQKWTDFILDVEFRIKPDYSKEIAELERQIQELKNK
jgi:hypothetical protein